MMATIQLKGNPVNTSGELPQINTTATSFTLVATNLQEKTLADYDGKYKVISTFPSVETGTCAAALRTFNEKAAQLSNTVVLCISKDLPFAFKRFCEAEGITNVETLSAFNSTFAQDYGLELIDSPLKGLCSRTIIILNKKNHVIYTQQVAETSEEPNYDEALTTLETIAV